MAILEIRHLNFTYPGATAPALCDISLTVEKGDFVLICGESGCGKTTLLRLLKKQMQPEGCLTGSIRYNGTELSELPDSTAAAEIGYVMQNPENQIVTDKVWHELAFGLESLGEETYVIRRKAAEICGFLGIGEWYRKKTCELSGGQKQLLSLASVLVMQPDILLLDEPTGQLDPIAASELITVLRKLNDELGITVILAEHRLEEIFPIANRVVLMDRAKVFLCDTPRAIGLSLATGKANHKLSLGLPASVRLFAALGGTQSCPLTVKEGKRYVSSVFRADVRECPAVSAGDCAGEKAIEIQNGYFRYSRELPDVLNGLSLDIFQNEILCILGANGAGKTTLLQVISGVNRLYRGKYRLWGKRIKEYTSSTLYRNNIAMLPQNPRLLFVKNTVYGDLLELTKILEYSQTEAIQAVEELMQELEIEHIAQSHPYDLSGGEAQKAALCKVLLMKPRILLLDEPTKGLDACSKKTLAELLIRLKGAGKSVVITTHDAEFAAEYAERCAMFFDGQIVSCDKKVPFFAKNNYYTTACARITRPIYRNAVTVDATIQLLSENGYREDT